MRNIASLLKPGGRAYVKAPYRFAVFAILNRVLPVRFKNRIMHYLFPGKSGDGFPAFYDGCSPSAMLANAATCGLEPAGQQRVYYSTYFTFFVPSYLVWRAISLLQYALDRDYCEAFELVLVKHAAGDGGETGQSADAGKTQL